MESCQHPLKSAMRICMIFVLWSISLGWPQEMPPDIRDSKYYTLANIYYGWRLLYPVLFIFRLVQSKIRHWLGFEIHLNRIIVLCFRQMKNSFLSWTFARRTLHDNGALSTTIEISNAHLYDICAVEHYVWMARGLRIYAIASTLKVQWKRCAEYKARVSRSSKAKQ